MKIKFKDFITENKENTWKIYCDMDGVLCDFDRQLKDSWLDEYNKENNTNYKNGWDFDEKESSNKFWKNVEKFGVKFWSDMPWMKDGKKLWNYIKKYDTEILSTPSRDSNSKKGKYIWCKRELNFDKDKITLTKQKYLKANETSILIDDLKKNVDKFKEAGGVAILHKNTEDTIKKLKDLIK